MFAGTMLSRPMQVRWTELAFAAAIAVAFIVVSPSLPRSALITTAVAVLASLAAMIALHLGDTLFDAWPPLSMAFLMLAGTAWNRVDLIRRQRRQSQQALLRLEAEMDVARDVQSAILPQTNAIAGLPVNIEIEAVLEQARFVGGDFYDAFMLPDGKLFFVVADVSGKGPEGAFFMAIAKAFVQSVALGPDSDPAVVLARAEREIMRNNPKNLFVTAIAGTLDPVTGALVVCNAGHPPPLLMRVDGALEFLKTKGGPPVAMVPGVDYATSPHCLGDGERLILFTDGISELVDQGEDVRWTISWISWRNADATTRRLSVLSAWLKRRCCARTCTSMMTSRS